MVKVRDQKESRRMCFSTETFHETRRVGPILDVGVGCVYACAGVSVCVCARAHVLAVHPCVSFQLFKLTNAEDLKIWSFLLFLFCSKSHQDLSSLA